MRLRPSGAQRPFLRVFALGLAAGIALFAGFAPSGSALAGQGRSTKMLAPASAPGTKALPGLTRWGVDSLTQALDEGSISPARYALERARSLFGLGKARARFGDVKPVPSEAVTAVLRDLVLRIGELSPQDQAAAKRVFSRPDDPEGEPYGTPYSGGSRAECSVVAQPGFCIHWATGLTDPNRPPLIDEDQDTIPDWVETTIQTFEEVWASEIAKSGFRPPKSDATSANPGPDQRIDIYLANVGSDRIYGYCTTDDPNALNNRLGTNRYPYYDVSAYCVLDNDFSKTEFRDGTPLSNLQVTAAHEFFHAIQSAYDFYEDWWMLEGTATAVEDLVYDSIDDNYQYLPASQFVRPEVPIDFSANDFSDPSFLNRYGSWVFWRFLIEHLAPVPGEESATILREVWERADASSEKRYGDATSIRAATGAVKSRGIRFSDAFNDFGVSLYVPEITFSEAGRYLSYLRANDYGRAPFAHNKKLSAGKPSARIDTRIDHLSHKLISFVRGSGTGRKARLRLSLKGAPVARGTGITVLSVHSDNTVSTKRIALNPEGDGRTSVGFGPDVVRVVAVLSNASGRFKGCDKRLLYSTSCGRPRDDNLRFILKAKLL